MFKIFKIGFLAFLFYFTVLAGVYFCYPRIIYKSVRATAIGVLNIMGKDQTYNTAYGIHPYMLHKVQLVIEEANSKGIDLRVVSGYRSIEVQRMLYDQGRTTKGGIVTHARPGFSYHNYGWAVDVCEYTDGKPNWDSDKWDLIGEIGKKHGLIWGGDWKRLVDKPHLQLSLNDIIKYGIY